MVGDRCQKRLCLPHQNLRKFWPLNLSMSPESAQTNIRYIFEFSDSNTEAFDLKIDRNTGKRIPEQQNEFPDWARLSFEKCPNCPLIETESEFCPAAIALMDTVRRLGRTLSHAKVDLVVILEDRWIGRKTTSQIAISSFMGLQIATSGCPNVDFLRPMARFHLPLSTPDETLTRTVGMYFLRQFFRAQSGASFDMDLEGLKRSYSELQTVNSFIARRLRASKEITEMNAFAALDQLAQLIPMQIEDALEDVRRLFTES